MAQYIKIALFTLFHFPLVALAQGGFGHAFFGASAPVLGASLQSSAGESFTPGAVQPVWGGGGFGAWGRVLLGGQGFGSIRQSVATDRGNGVQTDYGGGFFQLGYVARHSSRWFLYGYGGVGGFSMTQRITNRGEAPIEFAGAGARIEPGAYQKVETGGWGFDLGLSINRLLFKAEEQAGGYKIGLQAGASFFPGLSPWTLGDQNIGADGRMGGQLYYLRLTFGGGWLGKND